MHRIKRILSVLLAAAMLSALLAGCSGGETEPAETDKGGQTAAAAASSGSTDKGSEPAETGTASNNGGTAAEPAPANTSNEPKEGWTILVYLCGSDLESNYGCATSDLMEMIDAQYSEKVNVVVQTGGALTWDNGVVEPGAAERYVLTDGSMAYVEGFAEANMGKADTLSDFVSWGVENYPADYMGLIFWNHGGGSISGVCFDERNSYDSLSIREIDTALSQVKARTNKTFEFIGFDACLMATLETAAMLVPYANYMYASEETEPGAGWNYFDILNFLAENPAADGSELGELQYMSYYDYCMENGYNPGVTFSIVDLSEIPAVVEALNVASAEMLSSDNISGILRGALKADNFGGNSRSEGYTNMVDLGDLMRKVKDYVPSAKSVFDALKNAVIYNVNASQHEGAKGLSIYYPLSVQGSDELSIFNDICPSENYRAFVGWITQEADMAASSESRMPVSISESTSLNIEDAYLDEGGNYTVLLSDMDAFGYGSCSLYIESDGWFIYFGEDDNVSIDYDECMIQDNFYGQWLYLGEWILPVELVSQNEYTSVYSCDVVRNGEYTYLQIIYDWETGEFKVIGTWDGIDSETGMAARSAKPLENGDVLSLVYWFIDENDEWDYFESDEFTVDGELEVYYDYLNDGDYYYAINIYDIYGTAYQLDFTVFNVEDGEVYFYED